MASPSTPALELTSLPDDVMMAILASVRLPPFISPSGHSDGTDNAQRALGPVMGTCRRLHALATRWQLWRPPVEVGVTSEMLPRLLDGELATLPLARALGGVHFRACYCEMTFEGRDEEAAEETTKRAVEALAAACPRLARVSFAEAYLSDTAVGALARGCARLTDVDLAGCPLITDAGVEALAGALPALTSLVLSYCDVGDAASASLGHHCASLANVKLNGCGALTDAGVAALARGCAELRELNVNGCRILGSAAARALARGCPRLTAVHFDGCGVTDAGVGALVAGCPELAEVTFADCVSLTDTACVALSSSRGGNGLSKCDFGGCLRLTDVAVLALAKPALHSAVFYRCPALTDDALRALARTCPALVAVDFGFCGITDNGVEALLRGCPRLASLAFPACPRLTDAIFDALARGHPTLSAVNVTSCGLACDSMGAVVAACPALSEQDVLMW